ncbi:MAG: ribosome silencing factor [Armatimonadetes bacterium]|nr:ribosome silencing factor [Armatimonadota bacterium]
MASTNSKKNVSAAEKAELIREYADDMKAERIEVIDVSSKTAMMEYLVVCSGTSDTHINAIGDKVSDRLRDVGVKPIRNNAGANAGGWIYYDYGDVVFHVMLEEKRQFYDLETLWKMTPPNPTIVE